MMGERGMDAAAISDLLYRRSGLLGLSGLSNDMRVLHASDAPAAREAIDYFVMQLRRAVASLAAAIGGLDALVFTAGIGENDAVLRARVLGDLHWMGMRLDEEANRTHGRPAADGRISAPDSAVRVMVLPTDEEQMIARHIAACLGPDAGRA
jgi:acetate kinase